MSYIDIPNVLIKCSCTYLFQFFFSFHILTKSIYNSTCFLIHIFLNIFPNFPNFIVLYSYRYSELDVGMGVHRKSFRGIQKNSQNVF